MIGIHFRDVTVRYAIYNSRAQSLRNHLVHLGTGGRLSREARSIVTVTALDGVSFDINEGDRIGLVGHNGAGKTTMLRTMAGIYHPISGEVRRTGRCTTLIEPGAGMDVELSGYENILRMGMLLGASRAELEAATPEIEAFTELGDYLSVPVRTYPSGMMMRLMFAVATSRQPEILLMDEMFGTGDASFRERAERRMQELIERANILIFASHDHPLIKRHCNRVFALEHGKMREMPAEAL